MSKAIQVYTAILAAILTIAIFTSYANRDEEKTEATVTTDEKNLPQVIEAIDLDRPFSFAGETVPMENFDVRERLDRELIVNTYRHSSTILSIKRAYKYFPVIEPILAKNGIPDDFKYLAVAESNLENATSPAGAKGFWQFMKASGDHYGLEINSEVDERYHLEKATEAACQYLIDAKKRFGSWTAAAASYNIGGTRFAREIERQRADTYYDLNLNEETSRYVFRLIALKEIISYPQDFGFYLKDDDKYPPLNNYRIVEVDTSIANLGDFADQYGISYRILKVYNPWLISYKLTNSSRKTYEFKIPEKANNK